MMCWILSALGSSSGRPSLSSALRGYESSGWNFSECGCPTCFTACAASAGAGWRHHGDYYPEHLVLTAALRVEAGELSGGSHVIGRKTDSAGMLLGGCHDFPFCWQIVVLATVIGCPVWGIFCDKYGRRIVSVKAVLFHVLFRFFLRVLTFWPVPLCKTGPHHFLVQHSVFWPAERLCSDVQLAAIPTVPRRLWRRRKPSGVGFHPPLTYLNGPYEIYN